MNNDRLFILKSEDEEIILPITPAQYEIVNAVEYKNISIVEIGSIFVAGMKKNDELKFESFFPANDYSFAKTTITEPQHYIDKIKAWQKDKIILQLIISGTEINIPVRIHEFIYGETDGTNDVDYQLTLGPYEETETVEVAGWELPKRTYNPPRTNKKSERNPGKGGNTGGNTTVDKTKNRKRVAAESPTINHEDVDAVV